jgi:uncharacterized protein (TIGR03000 family)
VETRPASQLSPARDNGSSALIAEVEQPRPTLAPLPRSVVTPAKVKSQPAVASAAPASGKTSGSAVAAGRVTVTLPAEAKLLVQGVACPLTSAKRTFDTPKLPVGESYTYTLRAEVVRAGRTVVESRQVSIAAGKRVTVDFGNMSEAPQAAGPASVTVLLPEEARLRVQGVTCPLTSAKRTFSSPRLQAGQSYTYTLQAEVVRGGQSVTENRRVTVAAGQRVVVDFGNLSPAKGEGVAAAR